MNNKITANDVKKIYERIEKSKQGTFFIDSSSKKISEITPNHVDEPIASFYYIGNKDGFNIDILKEDGKIARNAIKDLIE